MNSLTLKTLKIFWQHARRYRWHFFGILAMLMLSVAAEAVSPYLYKKFINILATNNPAMYPDLIKILGLILMFRLIRSYSFRIKDFLNNYFEPRVMSDLVNTSFAYLHNNSFNFFSGNFVGSLVNKVKKFERGFEIVTDRITEDFLRTFLAIIFAVTMLWLQFWLLGLAVLVWCILYVVIIYRFSMFKMKYDLQKAAMDSKITGQLADTFTNNANIKLFSNFPKENRAFRRITDAHFRIRRFSWNLMTSLETIQGTLMIALEIFMMYLGIKYWLRGILTVGDFILIYMYMGHIADKLWGMGKHVRSFYEALADANEMTEILLESHEVQDIPGAAKLTVPTGAITFQEVSFGYRQDANILKNFQLTIPAGQRVALIGPSGGGKSTIVKLLFRFHDIQKGQITIDGQDISKVTQDSLRDALSLVPQDPILFHRTLMENIRYARPGASDEEVIEAAKLAHCHEFISQSSHQYNTFVGERGIKLSGGERQRVAIARAILKNAPILVLDEATSSLDSESEHYIQDSLKKLMQGKTVIVIAHRLSTIMQMDRILVLEKGEVKEEGKHEELLKMKQGTYQKLWQIQAGGFA